MYNYCPGCSAYGSIQTTCTYKTSCSKCSSGKIYTPCAHGYTSAHNITTTCSTCSGAGTVVGAVCAHGLYGQHYYCEHGYYDQHD